MGNQAISQMKFEGVDSRNSRENQSNDIISANESEMFKIIKKHNKVYHS